MFAIALTDGKWFLSLKQAELNSYVNFWTPTPWNIKNPKPGDKWYLFLKAPIRMIGGFGEVVEYKNLTPFEAWRLYGPRNGYANITDFVSSIQSYIDRNSQKFGGTHIDIHKYTIGCVILKNCQFWDEDRYIKTEDFDIIIKDQIVKYKLFKGYDPFIPTDNDRNYKLLNEPREDYKRAVNQRKGQGEFKGLILKAYNNRCCISGETCPELLEAAHLQPYVNENSNHVQNGILLRIDLHRLYDYGLIYIDSKFKVHISTLLKSTMYKKLESVHILLPEQINDYPSLEALKLNHSNFRK